MELHLSTSVCFCFLLSLSILLPTAQGEEPEVKLVDERPYLSIGSTWKPICGHYFWDNNVGASIFCKKLGYLWGGIIEKERNSYNEDAFYVGGCGSKDITDLENGCTKPNLVAPHDCKKGRPVSIKIKCTEGLWWQMMADEGFENCLEPCGGKGGACDTGFCGPDALCCKEGSGECPPEAEKASPTDYTCVTQTGPWIQKSDKDCWGSCGYKGGACPSFCKPDGYCCRQGFDDCPTEAANASPHYHTCVTPYALWWQNIRKKTSRRGRRSLGTIEENREENPTFTTEENPTFTTEENPTFTTEGTPASTLGYLGTPTTANPEENRNFPTERNPTFTTEGTPTFTTGYYIGDDEEGGDDDL